MVSPNIPQTRGSARFAKKAVWPWAITASALGVGIVGGSLGLWMHQNAAEAFTAETDISPRLTHDQKLGVSSNLLGSLRQDLTDIQKSRVLFLPATYFGSLAGVPAELSTLKNRSAHLLGQDMQYQRQLALKWGNRLVSTEGKFASLSASQVKQQVTSATTPSQLADKVKAWQAQYQSWGKTLHQLASIGGGLTQNQPRKVVQTVNTLQSRLNSSGAYWQGVNTAKAAVTEAHTYLASAPTHELSGYTSLMSTLTQALQGLQPPTTAQLLQVLSQISNGLEGNQPQDVLDALSGLKNKLNGANSQWSGYSQAGAAVTAGNAYLEGSTLSQINDHTAIIHQLNEAAAALIAPTPTFPTGVGNPFGSAFTQYLATRQSVVSVAVYNANTGATYTYNPGLAFDTASIVKATIMSTLLWQSQKSGKPLTSSEASLMIPMIEDSSNSAATALWNDAGHSAGIASFLQAAGMTATLPGKNGYWGLTQTTALDQVDLLKLLSYPNSVLTPASQDYALNLMQHVIGWEAWGVSTGPTQGSTVALKNGWLPIGYAGWEINSIGHVVGGGRNYVVAILSHNNPSEAYGIQTLDSVSQFVWNAE